MKVRNSVKAIILDGEKILLTKNQDDDGYFFFVLAGVKITVKHFIPL
ncbi:hypothetical protein [Viridibacillus arenosi]|uniref:Uncharacterized protein n=1 Tax=Viridibacillus arenosi FSL R5-213 TaxID=1227360 RepID=W4F1S1_9BACL|nr:hypothetical protein C176_08847 [Viridibacillus arenosi FSL R5-213]